MILLKSLQAAALGRTPIFAEETCFYHLEILLNFSHCESVSGLYDIISPI